MYMTHDHPVPLLEKEGIDDALPSSMRRG